MGQMPLLQTSPVNKIFMTSVKSSSSPCVLSDVKAAELAAATTDQNVSPNSLWQRLRSVVKHRSKFEKLVESILYRPPRNTISALEWGRNHEEAARTAYISVKAKETPLPYHVLRTGIHISSKLPWLAASPDSLVEDPTETSGRQHGILEIKCPYSARTVTPETACEQLNRFCCSLVDGRVTLKKHICIITRYKDRWRFQTSHGLTFVCGHQTALLLTE